MKNKKNFIVGITLLFTLLLSACTSPVDDSTPVVKKEDSSSPLQTIEGLPQSIELDFQESTSINFTSTGDGAFRISTNISDIVDATYSGSNSAGYKLTINTKNAGRTNLTITRLTTDNFRSASKTLAVTVNKLNQTISTAQIPDPFTIMADETKDFPVSSVGDGHLIAESSNPAIATADTSGDNLIIRALSAGTANITLRKAPTDNYKPFATTLVLTVVGQGSQAIIGLPENLSTQFQDSTSINFTSIGAGAFSVTSSAADVATADVTTNGNNFTLNIDIKKAGTTTISIRRAATDTLSEARFDIALTITKADQTITGLTELINLADGATMDFTIGGNGDGALTDTSEHSAIVTTSLTGNTLTLTAVAAGDASITLSKAATDNYNSITKRYAVVVLAQGVKLNQTIVGLADTLSLPFQDSNHTINFTSAGNGDFSVTSSTEDIATASISGNNNDGFILDIDLKKVGNTKLSIKRAATDTHLEATFDIALTINKANQTITGLADTSLTFQDSNHTINFTSAGNGDFSVTSSTTDVATASISGNNNDGFILDIDLKKAGTTTLSIKRATTDTHSEETLDIALTINKANQTITGLTELINLTVGATMDFTIGGNGDGALADNSEHLAIVTTSLTGNTLTLTAVAAGDASITLSKAATANYNLITNRYAVVVREQGALIPQTITLSPTITSRLDLKGGEMRSFTISGDGDGALLVTSDNLQSATATIDSLGQTLIINAIASGDAIITLTKSATSTFATEDYQINISTVPFEGGTGTSDNPYQITNIQQLQNINVALTAHYILNNNIDANATRNWNQGKGFSPIGPSPTQAFEGAFDGKGFIISDLYINRPSEYSIALFGVVRGSATNDVLITNLGLEKVQIVGNIEAASIVGVSEYLTISKSYATGFIKGNSWVAGLVAVPNESTIDESYFAGKVTGGGGFDVAGLIGTSSGGRGSLGFDVIGMSTINNSYTVGGVTSAVGPNIGGLAGDFFGGRSLTNSYAVNTVTIGNSTTGVGALIGSLGGAILENLFWNMEANSIMNPANPPATVMGVNSNVMLTSTESSGAAFGGWSTSIWDFGDTSSYPILRNNPASAELQNIHQMAAIIRLANTNGAGFLGDEINQTDITSDVNNGTLAVLDGNLNAPNDTSRNDSFNCTANTDTTNPVLLTTNGINGTTVVLRVDSSSSNATNWRGASGCKIDRIANIANEVVNLRAVISKGASSYTREFKITFQP